MREGQKRRAPRTGPGKQTLAPGQHWRCRNARTHGQSNIMTVQDSKKVSIAPRNGGQLQVRHTTAQ